MIFQLLPLSRLLVLLVSSWSVAGQDHRYPSHIWLMRDKP